MAEIKFEDALKKLEGIVGELEKGSLSLDTSLAKYEEGIKLSRICAKKLEMAKRKVELLVKSDSGKFEVAPFDEKKTGEPAKKAKAK